jgi:SAM-dependent methyltransferase
MVADLERYGTCSSCGRPSRFMRVGNRALLALARDWPYDVGYLGALATRENYPCLWCGRNYRTRVLAGVARPYLDGADVFEPATLGVFEPRIKRRARSFVVSEFFGPEYEPGTVRGGVRHEDLERLSFGDGIFDLVISSEVFEHVADPWAAFAEVRRVLRPGGRHVFTVPYRIGWPTSSRRNAPPVRHFDPIRPDGAVVLTDFGDDLPEILAPLGFTVTVRRFPSEREDVARVYDAVAV